MANLAAQYLEEILFEKKQCLRNTQLRIADLRAELDEAQAECSKAESIVTDLEKTVALLTPTP